MATSDSRLKVEDIHTFYGDSYVLHGMSLEVPPGKAVALLGRNGMGKTTLIRSVAGLTPPRQGRISFKGQELSRMAPYDIARLGIGLVPQGRRIFPSLSVKEHLMLPTSRLAKPGNGGNDGGQRWDLDGVFEQFPRLKERAKQAGGSLSGGEQQMLAIARALMANPELVLMDEPSEGLAPVIVQQIGDIMELICSQGHSLLLVEQNLQLALRVADYVYVISSGCVVYEGQPEELEKEEGVLNQYLGV